MDIHFETSIVVKFVASSKPIFINTLFMGFIPKTSHKFHAYFVFIKNTSQM
jgi:hypothetical protein